MPSGKVHDNIAFLSLIPIFALGYFWGKLNLTDNLLLTFSCLFCQLMFGPDLDTNSKQYKRWGLLRLIWLPYRKILGHRSRYTHGLLWGPIIRCIYLTIASFTLLIATLYAINYFLEINLFPLLVEIFLFIITSFTLENFLNIFVPILCGLFIGTAIHTLTDKIASFFKNLI